MKRERIRRPDGRFNFTFTSAGRYTYRQIHPNMIGMIVVQ